MAAPVDRSNVFRHSLQCGPRNYKPRFVIIEMPILALAHLIGDDVRINWTVSGGGDDISGCNLDGCSQGRGLGGFGMLILVKDIVDLWIDVRYVSRSDAVMLVHVCKPHVSMVQHSHHVYS